MENCIRGGLQHTGLLVVDEGGRGGGGGGGRQGDGRVHDDGQLSVAARDQLEQPARARGDRHRNVDVV